MAGISYLKGDATSPQAKGVKLICHICNDLGGWGKGFALAISRRWDEPEEKYRARKADRTKTALAWGVAQPVLPQRRWLLRLDFRRYLWSATDFPVST